MDNARRRPMTPNTQKREAMLQWLGPCAPDSFSTISYKADFVAADRNGQLERHQTRLTCLAKLLAVCLLGAGSVAAPRSTFASEPGTVGVAVNQLYSEQQLTKRGALIIRHVDPNSAAADAGIQAGDLILATDGKRVFNSELNELIKRLAGPVGKFHRAFGRTG